MDHANEYPQSRRAHMYAVGALYKDLDITGALCDNLLRFLVERPNIARHVHSLLLHADTSGPSLSLKVADAAWHMPALHTFIWDVPNAIQRDEMWDRLRA
jgi:hypothetical protein